MAVTHLRDEEIQAFLDANRSLDSATMQHIEKCESCSERLQQYKLLYQELNRRPVINLSKHFEETILQKVGLSPQSDSGLQLWQWILLSVVLILATGTSLAFIGMERIVQMQAAITNILSTTGDGLGDVQFVQQNFNLFFLSILVISAISLLDKIYITRLRR